MESKTYKPNYSLEVYASLFGGIYDTLHTMCSDASMEELCASDLFSSTTKILDELLSNDMEDIQYIISKEQLSWLNSPILDRISKDYPYEDGMFTTLCQKADTFNLLKFLLEKRRDNLPWYYFLIKKAIISNQYKTLLYLVDLYKDHNINFSLFLSALDSDTIDLDILRLLDEKWVNLTKKQQDSYQEYMRSHFLVRYSTTRGTNISVEKAEYVLSRFEDKEDAISRIDTFLSTFFIYTVPESGPYEYYAYLYDLLQKQSRPSFDCRKGLLCHAMRSGDMKNILHAKNNITDAEWISDVYNITDMVLKYASNTEIVDWYVSTMPEHKFSDDYYGVNYWDKNVENLLHFKEITNITNHSVNISTFLHTLKWGELHIKKWIFHNTVINFEGYIIERDQCYFDQIFREVYHICDLETLQWLESLYLLQQKGNYPDTHRNLDKVRIIFPTYDNLLWSTFHINDEDKALKRAIWLLEYDIEITPKLITHACEYGQGSIAKVLYNKYREKPYFTPIGDETLAVSLVFVLSGYTLDSSEFIVSLMKEPEKIIKRFLTQAQTELNSYKFLVYKARNMNILCKEDVIRLIDWSIYTHRNTYTLNMRPEKFAIFLCNFFRYLLTEQDIKYIFRLAVTEGCFALAKELYTTRKFTITKQNIKRYMSKIRNLNLGSKKTAVKISKPKILLDYILCKNNDDSGFVQRYLPCV